MHTTRLLCGWRRLNFLYGLRLFSPLVDGANSNATYADWILAFGPPVLATIGFLSTSIQLTGTQLGSSAVVYSTSTVGAAVTPSHVVSALVVGMTAGLTARPMATIRL